MASQGFERYRFSTKAALIALMAAWPLMATAAQGTSPLSVSFGPTAVTVTNVAPNGRVAIFAVAREPHRYYSTVTQRSEILTDTAGTGQVVLAVPAGVPNRAIWVIVDLTTGRYVVTPTAGYQNTPTEITEAILENDDNGQLRKMEIAFSETKVCLVRPGAGAWWTQAGKDSEADENKGHPSGIRLDLERMLPIADSGRAPKNFQKGDILLFVDPSWMRYAFLEVGK